MDNLTFAAFWFRQILATVLFVKRSTFGTLFDFTSQHCFNFRITQAFVAFLLRHFFVQQCRFQASQQIATKTIAAQKSGFHLIGNTLLQRSHADYNASNDLTEMIRANLIAERVAIEAYSQMVDLIGDKDPTTKRLVEQILNDEQEHAEELKTWLAL